MPDHEVEVLSSMMQGDDEALIYHADRAAPKAALSAVLGRVNALYEHAQYSSKTTIEHAPIARRLLHVAERVRQRAGAEQRDVDLHLMRMMRYSGYLCAVVGAGATMDAGGPSWPELVVRLLTIGLNPGFEEVKTKAPEQLSIVDLIQDSAEAVVGYRQFSGTHKNEARSILKTIESGKADSEILMRGAEMCLELAGQRLFADITQILYDEGKRVPGRVHESIAQLTEAAGDKPTRPFGWSAIITYNFDDLMGEAIDCRGIARAAWAMKGAVARGDPNEKAKQAGQQSNWLPVIHLHGYSPRRFFYISNVKFVFSTSQYETEYGADQRPILDSVFEQFLANPNQYACYIGCSFEDEYMNDLLRRAYEHLPGREHWALLKWPGSMPYEKASGEEIARHSSRFAASGVRPIWFDRFEEIPELLLKIK